MANIPPHTRRIQECPLGYASLSAPPMTARALALSQATVKRQYVSTPAVIPARAGSLEAQVADSLTAAHPSALPPANSTTLRPATRVRRFPACALMEGLGLAMQGWFDSNPPCDCPLHLELPLRPPPRRPASSATWGAETGHDWVSPPCASLTLLSGPKFHAWRWRLCGWATFQALPHAWGAAKEDRGAGAARGWP